MCCRLVAFASRLAYKVSWDSIFAYVYIKISLYNHKVSYQGYTPNPAPHKAAQGAKIFTNDSKKIYLRAVWPSYPVVTNFSNEIPLNHSNINASHCYSPTETLCNSQASNEKALLTPVIPRGARLSTKAKQYFYGTKVSFLKIWKFFWKTWNIIGV